MLKWRAGRSGGAEPQNPSRLPSADPLLGAKWIADFLRKEIPADLQELAVLRSPSLAVPKRALGDLGRVIRVSRAKQEFTEEQKLNTANCVWDIPGIIFELWSIPINSIKNSCLYGP